MMKKIFFILFILFTVTGMSQKNDTSSYPKYYIVNGDTLGIILTVKQAQKLDNDEDILNLFKKMNLNVDSTNSSCIQVINNLNQQIYLLNTKISDMNSEITIKTQMVNNLNIQNENYQKDDSLCSDQSKMKDGIINDQKKEIRKLKFQKIIGYAIGVAAILTETYIIISGK